MFRKRRILAREVVMIAMLCALVVLVSLIFRATVPINAGTALVIIAGISFGPAAGFTVGAVSRLVLNFFEGQGPWTIWQMLCWGALALFAGLIFAGKTKIKEHPIKHATLITLYTFVFVFVFYGGIMNLFTFLFMSTTEAGANTASILAIYLAGVPYDLFHAGTASAVIFIIGPGLIRAFERIKIKYGFYRAKMKRAAFDGTLLQ